MPANDSKIARAALAMVQAEAEMNEARHTLMTAEPLSQAEQRALADLKSARERYQQRVEEFNRATDAKN